MKQQGKYRLFLCIAIIFISLGLRTATAEDFTSQSYKVLSPVIAPGGLSTSSSFSLYSVLSPEALGSSSAASFSLFPGFLYIPFVTTPVVSATGGNAQVVLTWTRADSGVGFTVGSYEVGQSTASGSSYAYTNIGNVLTSTRTGLTNSTQYFFIIRVLDAHGLVIATSTETNATPVAPPPAGGGGGGGSGGGGGGGGGFVPTIPGSATIHFSGRAYPGSIVTILKDAQVAVTTIADLSANFQATVGNLSAGNYFFSAYSEDNKGERSSPVTFPVSVSAGASTNITGIFIAPTIGVDKSEVRRGDNLSIFGQTTGASEVTIQVNSDVPYFGKATADKSGVYIYNFDTAPLEYGDHSTKSKSSVAGEISSYSTAAAFKVTTQSIFKILPNRAGLKGDENGDGKVNLVDYSVVAFWYKRSGPPAKVDLNGDGKVDLIDFSILAYNWTG